MHSRNHTQSQTFRQAVGPFTAKNQSPNPKEQAPTPPSMDHNYFGHCPQHHYDHRQSGGDASYAQNMSNDSTYQLDAYKNKRENRVIPSTGSHQQKHNRQALPVDDIAYSTFAFDGISDANSGSSISEGTTVVKKRSSKDLRSLVKSQGDLLGTIDRELRQKVCNNAAADRSEKRSNWDASERKTTSKKHNASTGIANGDFIDCRPSDISSLNVSVDDIVNSKVINPMIRKFQHMFLHNLREEISVMEDLEMLPHKVNEIYKASINEQKTEK